MTNTESKTKGQIVGYIRVSTADQNVGRQANEFDGYSLDETFIDYASGKDTNRPELQAALKHLRKGDTLLVHSMDRLARNLIDLKTLVNSLNNRGVDVKFIKESLTFSGQDNAMSHLLLSMMGAFAEFERSLLLERQRDGIAIAKSKGVYKGRKAVLTYDQTIKLREMDHANLHKNRSHLASLFNISRPTLYQYLTD